MCYRKIHAVTPLPHTNPFEDTAGKQVPRERTWLWVSKLISSSPIPALGSEVFGRKGVSWQTGTLEARIRVCTPEQGLQSSNSGRRRGRPNQHAIFKLNLNLNQHTNLPRWGNGSEAFSSGTTQIFSLGSAAVCGVCWVSSRLTVLSRRMNENWS